jgi:hypothetical protein
MLHAEKLNFNVFFNCKIADNSVLFMTSSQGKDAIIMLKRKNTATKRISEFPRNVIQLTAVQNLRLFNRFITVLAARTSQELNYAAIAQEVEVD